jgi:hypothetical protein
MDYNYSLEQGRRKKNSCLYYRKDTICGDFDFPVCEKKGFNDPGLVECSKCKMFASCLNISKRRQRNEAQKRDSKVAYFKFRNNLLLLKKRCNVCGSEFETTSLTRNRCIGRCQRNLTQYI